MNREFEMVLPAYNEAASLPTLLKRFADSAQSAGFTPGSCAAVIVDNGSTDKTPEVLHELESGPLAPWFSTVRIDRNQGYGHGVWTGLTYTTADIVGWSHADLQCSPTDAFEALRMLRSEGEEKTLVKGHRHGRHWRDKAVSRVFEACAHAMAGLRVTEINAQPKVFSRRLLEDVANPPPGFEFDLYFLFVAERSGYRIMTIPVDFPPRIHGLSRWAGTFLGRYRTIFRMFGYLMKLRREERRK